MKYTLKRTKITELTRNALGKEYSKERSFPSSFEYSKFYKPFDVKLNFKISDKNVEIRVAVNKDNVLVVGWIDEKAQKSSIAMLHLYKRPTYNKFGYDLYEVKNAYVREDFIGMGLMPQIYNGIVNRGYNIVALNSQSEGARNMWFKFYTQGNMKVWGVIGVRFFVNPEEGRSKKDWIETLYITDSFINHSVRPELSAVVLTDDGVESVKSMYVDTEGYEDLESILILTSKDSDLSEDLDMMMSFEEFPEEENLYKTLTKMLLTNV